MSITPERHAAPAPGQRAHANMVWGARARALIEQTHALYASWLEAPLLACLLDAEQKLFEQSWLAPGHAEQQAYISSRQRLQSYRDAIEQRFRSEVIKRFEQIGATVDNTAAPMPLALSATLSLLDNDETDEHAMLEQVAARSEARHASTLFELGYRFAALAAQPPLAGDKLPLSAQAQSLAFLDALREWELPAAHRVLLLDAFDHAVVRELLPLYETINQHLIDAGVLPYLRAYRVARPGEDPRPHVPADAADAGPAGERHRAERGKIDQAVAVCDLIHDRPIGRLGDLSATGLQLISHAVPRSDAVYQVSLRLPGTGTAPPLELGIQEQWQDAAAAPGQVWAGFRIVSISPADAERLDTWLAPPGSGD